MKSAGEIRNQIKMENNVDSLENVIFTGANTEQRVIFDNKEPIIMLVDILQPIVKVENCTWLEEI